MKKILKTLQFSAVIILALGFTACSDDDDNNNNLNPGDPNLVEVALERPDLTTLVQALQIADGDLVSVLTGDGPFTVLAPTNAAFENFLDANGFASLSEVPTDVLSQILLNHVLSADITSSDLITAGAGYTNTNATNGGGLNLSLFFNTDGGVTFNGISSVTEADLDADNGTLHIVDAVIGLPTIVDLAAPNPSFSSLVAALGAADGNLVDVLTGTGPFTVMAPDNAAFNTFLNGTPLEDVDPAALSQILLNHVLVGSLETSDILISEGAGYKNTAANGPGGNALSLYFNATDGVSFNGVASVTAPDVIGTNGVIHAVDAVIDIPTVVTFAVADPNFSTLVDALTILTPATDFPSILSRTQGGNDDGINPSFTVFAPTNAAFDALGTIPGEAVLTQVLLHHVVSEANITSGDLNNPGDTVATTLQGDTMTITLPGSNGNIANITDGSGNSDIGIVAVNVQAGNGVIHVINKVMLPN